MAIIGALREWEEDRWKGEGKATHIVTSKHTDDLATAVQLYEESFIQVLKNKQRSA